MASNDGAVVKDLTAGTFAGVTQLLVGHPFDTIKVKLQSQPVPAPGQQPMYSGAVDAVRKTVGAEGPRGLYKGMGAPLATVAVFNAVLFTARGQMEALLRSSPTENLSVYQQMVAGVGAGVAVAFVACPTELVKCRLQAQSALAGVPAAAGAATSAAPSFASLEPAIAASTAAPAGASAASIKSSPPPRPAAAAPIKMYNGPLDVARHVIRSEGGVLGLYKGMVPTLMREMPGNAAMFGGYEMTKQMLAGGRDTSQLGQGSLLIAGGVGGALFWASVYPTDVVKSVIQVDNYQNPKYKGTLDAFRKVYATEGMKGMYKGFGPAMARSVPANAACFLAYEMIRGMLG
ncbi:hypothetical protein CBR_g21058 [Chara braunii]|uniref:Mitochondrial carnitine/acylcarnitine carrier-like protein n=1 Tax=Chara braunii TaxID=69332 RepID=A0A388L0S7_CHABU|nr:hypothetical protein CBR_g21058 [Chara braunii]|eukprot:GBG75813.1 hypothetical protein CBR_g21058 [Chara braunii]